MKTLYIEGFRRLAQAIDAITSHRDFSNGSRYFFSTNPDSLHQGRISVTHGPCVEAARGDSGESTYELNRRQTCLRASKLSLPSASLQSSQHAAASKKKKWLLLIQWLKSPYTTSSNTFAGRPEWPAPQNPTFSAIGVEWSQLISNILTSAVCVAFAGRLLLRADAPNRGVVGGRYAQT